MNKIYLKKSFAGYPVGEYELIGSQYVIVDEKGVIRTGIHKDIVEGMKDHFEEIKERPTSWEELGMINGYWIECDGTICNEEDTTEYDGSEIMFKTKEQAEASIALAQITQLLDKYDIPEMSRDRYYIYEIPRHTSLLTSRRGLLRFDTLEKRNHFYKHHADLISKLAPFYIS